MHGIFIYSILTILWVCQSQLQSQQDQDIKYKMIAGKKSEYTFPLSSIGYVSNFDISSNEIQCSNAEKQYAFSTDDSSSMNGGTSVKLQHSVLRSFEQIQQLSSIVDVVEYNHQIYCLLMNGTLLVYKLDESTSKPKFNLKNKLELTKDQKQLEIGKIVVIQTQATLLILCRGEGFRLSGNDLKMIQNYPKTMTSFTSAALVSTNGQIIIAVSFGNQGIQYMQLSSNNQLLQLAKTEVIINQKLVNLQKNLNQQQQGQFPSQAKDFRLLQSSTLNNEIFLIALDALKGLVVYQVKMNSTASTVAQEAIYIDLHTNRQGQCQNLKVYNEVIYFSCKRVYKMNLTQIVRVYKNVVSDTDSNINDQYLKLATQFPTKFQDSFIIDMGVLNNFLVLSTHNQLRIYWHHHYLAKYKTSNIEKVILINGRRDIRIILTTPASLFLMHLKTLDSSIGKYGNKFECKSDPSLKSQTYQTIIRIQKQCQNNTKQICNETSKIAFQVTNQNDRDIMILIISIAVVCVLCIGGVISFMLNEIRLINQKKNKMKQHKQYSNMLEQKEGYLQFQVDRIDSGKETKDQYQNKIDKADNMKLKGSYIQQGEEKQYRERQQDQRSDKKEQNELESQVLKQSQTHL